LLKSRARFAQGKENAFCRCIACMHAYAKNCVYYRPTLCIFECRIADLKDLLERKERILQIVEEEADEVAKKHGNERRAAIVSNGMCKRQNKVLIVLFFERSCSVFALLSL